MELLVRIEDKDQPDPVLSIQASKRGDVISVCPDGWGWSNEEKANDFWRIISVPLLPVEAAALVSPPSNTALDKRRRVWTLDFSILPPAQQAKFTGARTDAIISLPRGQVVAMSKQKP